MTPLTRTMATATTANRALNWRISALRMSRLRSAKTMPPRMRAGPPGRSVKRTGAKPRKVWSARSRVGS